MDRKIKFEENLTNAASASVTDILQQLCNAGFVALVDATDVDKDWVDYWSRDLSEYQLSMLDRYTKLSTKILLQE